MNLNLPFLKSNDALPGGVTRPTWVVLDLSGPYPERQPTNPVAGLLSRTESLEALAARVEKLRGAAWLHGVLVRFGEFTAAPATARGVCRRGRRARRPRRRLARRRPPACARRR